MNILAQIASSSSQTKGKFTTLEIHAQINV